MEGMDENKLLLSLMQVFIAQMDSALKISNIISEHSNEEEMSPDSIIIGLIYRLMISMDDKEMKESMDLAKNILNEESEYSSSEDDCDYEDEYLSESKNDIDNNKKTRNIIKNTCNCNICARARACLLNYNSYEATDQLTQKFKNAIDKTCKIHKINIV